ncbi:MAG: RNA methyltransferase [Candidatus Delongbacteria bacterium]|nr:RNA methyltransferase [Candidatus Delongbacteria bacterium]
MKKENIKIILSRTWSPGNIGSILRSMKNFDFSNIVAVDQINFDDIEMNIMAAGAKDHIRYLRNSDDLKTEVESCNVVYAFTARKRKYYKYLTPKSMANEIIQLGNDVKVGLLFGNETNGLTNDETDLADKLVCIPTSEKYSSMNLASAVMIALYELSNSLSVGIRSEFSEDLINLKEKEELFNITSSLVSQKLMHKSNNQKKIRENIRHLLKRVNLNKKEIGFIRSIIKIIDINIPEPEQDNNN